MSLSHAGPPHTNRPTAEFSRLVVAAWRRAARCDLRLAPSLLISISQRHHGRIDCLTPSSMLTRRRYDFLSGTRHGAASLGTHVSRSMVLPFSPSSCEAKSNEEVEGSQDHGFKTLQWFVACLGFPADKLQLIYCHQLCKKVLTPNTNEKVQAIVRHENQPQRSRRTPVPLVLLDLAEYMGMKMSFPPESVSHSQPLALLPNTHQSGCSASVNKHH